MYTDNMKCALTVILVLGSLCAVNAQVDSDREFSLGWDINVPLSNRDYISNTSTRGFRFGYREKISDNVFLGADLNNATFNGYTPRRTYATEGGALTTDFFNYTYSYGLTLAGDYYLAPSKKLSPFVSLGLGANYNSYKRYYNIYSSEDSGWGFLVRPEAGAILKMGRDQSWGIIGSVRMDYSTASSELAGYSGFTSLGFRLGIVVLDWR